MRPTSLDDYVGQAHLVGKGCILRNMIDSGSLSSFILWGPPGVGKTTLARIIAGNLGREFHTLSAVSAGVGDVRKVIESAGKASLFNAGGAPSLSTRFTASTRRSRMPCWVPWRRGRSS